MPSPRTVDRPAAALAIETFLRALGLDPATDRELRGTGARVADAFIDELCAGYDVDVDALIRANVLEGEAGIVIVRRIHVTTMCPHHLLPATGTADVAFAPNGELVGVGTVARVARALSQRLVLQESLGESIVDAFVRVLAPTWAACRIDLSHACLTARGEREHQARVTTLSVRGTITTAETLALFGPTEER